MLRYSSGRFALALAAVVLSAGAAHAHDASSLPDASAMPEGTIQLSPVLPAMGQHWGNPADMPVGPIYCVHEGKIICLEYMLTQADFAAGKSWQDLKGMDGLPPVDHIDIGFEPQGHEGFEVPHYDIHLYFIPAEDVARIK